VLAAGADFSPRPRTLRAQVSREIGSETLTASGETIMVTCVTAVRHSEPLPDLLDTLATERLLAVTVLEDSGGARSLAAALLAGGLRCVEVTLRTDSALATIATMAATDGLVVGAGTVLTVSQADQVIDAGARFVVSPGFNADVVGRCQERGVTVFPGVATATEIQMALAAGVETVKFFPAELLGGTAMVKALAAPFRSVRFIPTGGIDASNAGNYLALPSVLAVGGTWMVPAQLLQAGDWSGVERLTRAAVVALREGAGA
jgi:2-dehydro-3-deoxyphosphogluconate aldolase/(4S)-4-hydroxy-2-oxoglutarate aldolase